MIGFPRTTNIMKILYRISDAGYSKVKPAYVNNESCLKNFTNVFDACDITIIADNISRETNAMIQRYVDSSSIIHVSIGHGAGTFNIALDIALTYHDDEVVYFVENDYLHRVESPTILAEGIGLGSSFVSLYDHPDKYMNGSVGGNPYVVDGGEVTRVLRSDNCWWKLTNSTSMTFASRVATLRKTESVMRKWTSGDHPNDFSMFLELRDIGESLLTPIPGYSTHGETAWLAPSPVGMNAIEYWSTV